MAGLNHDFFLVSKTEYPYAQYAAFINDPKAIQIHDDLIQYMLDSLWWIPTFNPARKEDHQGLCLFGPTVIKSEGAPIAERIFAAWASLFSNGPEIIKLRGLWTSITGDDPKKGAYATIQVRRDEIVDKLQKLRDYADQVVKSNGDLYILHIGI